ncbi:MAG: hypothetical protein AAGA30_06850 [Planctomycetota bacterium]
MKTRLDGFGLLLIVAICCLSSGCRKDYGVELYSVSGTITLDGEPLKNASIQFRPDKTGKIVAPRGGIGYTDENGQYVMLFRDTRGCPAGKFHVVVSTYSEPYGDKKQGQKEVVPQRYRGTESILSATVESESNNEFNFELTSN